MHAGLLLVQAGNLLGNGHGGCSGLCTGGFGSHAGASGRGVFATCLSDGEKTRWNRENFVGVIADSQLPDWAREKLDQLQGQKESKAPAPEMGGMTMQ